MISKRCKILRKNQRKRSNRRSIKIRMRGGSIDANVDEISILEKVREIMYDATITDKNEKIAELLNRNGITIAYNNFIKYQLTIHYFIDNEIKIQKVAYDESKKIPNFITLPFTPDKITICSNLRKIGFNVTELKEAIQLYGDKNKIFTTKDILTSYNTDGITQKDITELRTSKFTAQDIKFHIRGVKIEMLLVAGFSLPDLKTAGFSAHELRQAKVSLPDLKTAGFSARELRKAEFSLQDLISLGDTFTLSDLKEGYDLINTKNLSDIFQSGKYTYGEIKNIYNSYIATFTSKNDIDKLNNAKKQFDTFKSSITGCEKTGWFASGDFKDDCKFKQP